MKVILQKDVPKIGRKYEVKDVPDGYAQNFLLPRKLALRATPDSLRRLEQNKSKHALDLAASATAFKEALASASAANATVAAEAAPEGSLYRAVHTDDIAKAFAEIMISELGLRSVGVQGNN